MPTAAKQSSVHRRTAAGARGAKDDAIKLLKADHKEVSGLLEKTRTGACRKTARWRPPNRSAWR